MISIRNISIRNKLVLMQVFTSVLVLGIFLVAFIITDIRSYKERRVKSLTSLAHVVGLNSESALFFQFQDEAREILQDLKNVLPEIVYADIVDAKGNTFASYKSPRADSFKLQRLTPDKLWVIEGNQLLVVDDMVKDGERIGKVMLQIEMTELTAVKKSKYSMGAILLFASTCFAFIIAFAVQPYISKRLLYLVNIMKKERTTGDYDVTIVDNGKDEISTLVQAYNKLMLQIKESQQRKDEFIGIASHELKTPLTSVKGYLDLLETVEDKQPNKQFVRKALESTHKLERLIKDLLDVSKIQSGQLSLNVSEFDIYELIDETIASSQMVSATHQIVREESSEAKQMIYADRQKIEQVLINLISNAIKYSPSENEVIIGTKKTDTELIVRVRDFGIGIPQEEIQDIFERFYRTKGSSVHISGFGLGLYICRDILKRHDGKIWVERESQGTSFYFSLPLQTNAQLMMPESVQEGGLALKYDDV